MIKPVHLVVTIRPGTWVDPTGFIKQIADAGYAARKDDIRLTLAGRLSRDADGYTLTLDDVKPGPQLLALQPATSKEQKERTAFSDAFKSLDRLAGQRVQVEGWWRQADDKRKPPQLLVRAASALK